MHFLHNQVRIECVLVKQFICSSLQPSAIWLLLPPVPMDLLFSVSSPSLYCYSFQPPPFCPHSFLTYCVLFPSRYLLPFCAYICSPPPHLFSLSTPNIPFSKPFRLLLFFSSIKGVAGPPTTGHFLSSENSVLCFVNSVLSVCHALLSDINILFTWPWSCHSLQFAVLLLMYNKIGFT